MKANVLKGFIAINEETLDDLADALGINTQTLYSKMAGRRGQKFTKGEIAFIRVRYHLLDSDIIRIFDDYDASYLPQVAPIAAQRSALIKELEQRDLLHKLTKALAATQDQDSALATLAAAAVATVAPSEVKSISSKRTYMDRASDDPFTDVSSFIVPDAQELAEDRARAKAEADAMSDLVIENVAESWKVDAAQHIFSAHNRESSLNQTGAGTSQESQYKSLSAYENIFGLSDAAKAHALAQDSAEDNEPKTTLEVDVATLEDNTNAYANEAAQDRDSSFEDANKIEAYLDEAVKIEVAPETNLSASHESQEDAAATEEDTDSSPNSEATEANAATEVNAATAYAVNAKADEAVSGAEDDEYAAAAYNGAADDSSDYSAQSESAQDSATADNGEEESAEAVNEVATSDEANASDEVSAFDSKVDETKSSVISGNTVISETTSKPTLDENFLDNVTKSTVISYTANNESREVTYEPSEEELKAKADNAESSERTTIVSTTKNTGFVESDESLTIAEDINNKTKPNVADAAEDVSYPSAEADAEDAPHAEVSSGAGAADASYSNNDDSEHATSSEAAKDTDVDAASDASQSSAQEGDSSEGSAEDEYQSKETENVPVESVTTATTHISSTTLISGAFNAFKEEAQNSRAEEVKETKKEEPKGPATRITRTESFASSYTAPSNFADFTTAKKETEETPKTEVDDTTANKEENKTQVGENVSSHDNVASQANVPLEPEPTVPENLTSNTKVMTTAVSRMREAREEAIKAQAAARATGQGNAPRGYVYILVSKSKCSELVPWVNEGSLIRLYSAQHKGDLPLSHAEEDPSFLFGKFEVYGYFTCFKSMPQDIAAQTLNFLEDLKLTTPFTKDGVAYQSEVWLTVPPQLAQKVIKLAMSRALDHYRFDLQLGKIVPR